MAISKSSASFIIVPSIIVIHLVNGTQLLNTTGVGLLCAIVTILPFTTMQVSLKSQRCDFKTSVL